MNIPKLIKRTLLGILASFLLLFVVLIAHIAYMVKHQRPLENPTIQMARVDFDQPVNSENIVVIKSKLSHAVGFKDAYYNPKSNIMSFSFDAKKNSAQNMYSSAFGSELLTSKLFHFNANEMKGGCPALDNHSFYGKLTRVVASVID